jgi:hypothetical protein
MGISEILIEQMAEYEASTNLKSTTIYLGLNEMNLLKRWGVDVFNMYSNTSDQIEFYGIKVYEVRIEKHLNVC